MSDTLVWLAALAGLVLMIRLGWFMVSREDRLHDYGWRYDFWGWVTLAAVTGVAALLLVGPPGANYYDRHPGSSKKVCWRELLRVACRPVPPASTPGRLRDRDLAEGLERIHT